MTVNGTGSVLVLMGSESDRDVMEKGVRVLEQAGVDVRVEVASAHREPDRTARLARTAREEGHRVVICGAGLSAALPGPVAAHTDLPVIGVPIDAALGGLDALHHLLRGGLAGRRLLAPGLPALLRGGALAGGVLLPACGHGYIFRLRSRTSVSFAVTSSRCVSDRSRICWRPIETCGMYFSM